MFPSQCRCTFILQRRPPRQMTQSQLLTDGDNKAEAQAVMIYGHSIGFMLSLVFTLYRATVGFPSRDQTLPFFDHHPGLYRLQFALLSVLLLPVIPMLSSYGDSLSTLIAVYCPPLLFCKSVYYFPSGLCC
ncbi:hypothetical protein XENOCAPTIV_013380 [Xenoophorus captivus]|uniref:Uncharacterized protein n=1 Tax=Xenoophorus captivus TaxID=1517983 RepID=A0ABV0R065_9TELE